MHKKFIDYLVDPEGGGPLELIATRVVGDEVLEGSFRAGGREYPIVRGIPRFAGFDSQGQYAESFGFQWNRWKRIQFDSENIGGPMEGHTRRMWERITGIDGSLSGQVIAEFGCGSGRFLETVRAKGARVIGLDLSSAVEAAAENFRGDPDVLICQADALKPPLKPDCLDGVFSIGVLHHTPSPALGIAAMVRVLKNAGWLSVCVYSKGSYYDSFTVGMYRRLFRAVRPIFGNFPVVVYSYIAAYVLNPLARIPILGLGVKGLFPFARLPDRRWCLLDTFDSVTPSYQSAHEAWEVRGWLEAERMESIQTSDWGSTAFRAKKGLAACRINAPARD